MCARPQPQPRPRLDPDPDSSRRFADTRKADRDVQGFVACITAFICEKTLIAASGLSQHYLNGLSDFA